MAKFAAAEQKANVNEHLTKVNSYAWKVTFRSSGVRRISRALFWVVGPAAEPRGNALNNFKDVRTENGSSEGRSLALTGLCVPRSLDSGRGSRTPVRRMTEPYWVCTGVPRS